MPVLTIKVQTFEEGLTKKNGLSFNPNKVVKELSMDEVCIMERGTQQGGTSLMFKLTDNDGNQFSAQLTGRLLEGLNSALQGAEARFRGV